MKRKARPRAGLAVAFFLVMDVVGAISRRGVKGTSSSPRDKSFWTFPPFPATIPLSMPGLLADPRQQAVILLFAGGLGLLISVMFSVRAAGFDDEHGAGRRILGHWLPIVAAVLTAVALGYAEVGVAIIFGTSVASLSVVSGFVVMAGPLVEVSDQQRRVWPILPVLMTLVFVLGLRGMLGGFEIVALCTQGLLMVLLGIGQAPATDVGATGRRGIGAMGVLGLIVAVALAVVAAWAATRGTQLLSEQDFRYPAGVIAASLLSIALALPMVSTGVSAASEGKPAIALSAQVGVVILNFTALLPATILLRLIVTRIAMRATTTSTTLPEIAPLIYPRLSWRIDAVALLILSLLMVPIAEGKLHLDRKLGGWLIFAYCVYLLTVLIVGASGA